MTKPKLDTLKQLKRKKVIRSKQLKRQKWTISQIFGKARKQAINTWALLIVAVIITDSWTPNPIT